MNTTLEIQEKRISARRALRLGLGREQLGQRGGPDGLVAALCPRSARASALRALSAPRARSAPAQLAIGAPRRSAPHVFRMCSGAARLFEYSIQAPGRPLCEFMYLYSTPRMPLHNEFAPLQQKFRSCRCGMFSFLLTIPQGSGSYPDRGSVGTDSRQKKTPYL